MLRKSESQIRQVIILRVFNFAILRFWNFAGTKFRENGQKSRISKVAPFKMSDFMGSFLPWSNTLFPLISAPSDYLILKLYNVALMGAWHLKEGSGYFKIRVTHAEF